MQRRLFALASTALAAVTFSTLTHAAEELRVMVHSSFVLPKPLLAQFEAQSGVKLAIIKGGDAGEMLNKLILTRARPVADVVFGIDNTLAGKALAAGVLEPTLAQAAGTVDAQLGGALAAVDYGFVTLNYDKAAVAKTGTPLPKNLQDLTLPAYKGWLVVPNPATSSPGHAFLLATIAGMGEEKAFAWWAQMRTNGLKVVKGWSEAYYTEFTRNQGSHPLVVSYATSPAAEVFYAKEKLTESPTASLNLAGGVFRQVEGVALIKGTAQPAAALKFVDFLRSAPVQQALQTEMWMYPAVPKTPLAPVMRHAAEPAAFESLPPQVMADQGGKWVARWTQVVLK
ncbi:thiamine ABC transporter substrate-binding protein [Rhodoferax sp. U2-2l]|uniref:thiamine ABC transporter substrate-binding protein n=1 Tax=Rhodoferax sp. U2-2l TaxID=2884000 RepID=UPI001D09C970|nr:thiamine ABC transporter substrate-binding protein [Rhodoferax sp. U2-2l]MCB8748482.1 thiamine ABC transporter substrate-binding protein [Rhodoferax sp. U2-2l]